MSPFKLITGSDKNIAAFEDKVSKALLDGYDLANNLSIQLKTNSNGDTEAMLFQPMICDEMLDDEDEDEDDEYEDEEMEEFDEESEFS